MRIKNRVRVWVSCVQGTLLATLLLLEYLSGYRAGLAQHLYFKKVSYLNQYYSSEFFVLQILFFILLTSSVILAGRNKGYFPTTLQYGVLITAFFICIITDSVKDLNIYAHLLLTLQFCMILEVISLSLSKRHGN